jgi:ABC-type nitrate/sulfonate/bicarbonate transport system substrate-binding protein
MLRALRLLVYRHRPFLLIAFALALAIGLTSCARTQPTTKVILMLDWVPNTNHTGIYVALAKGYYKEQGLELQIVEPGEGGSPEQVVAAGGADFGISYQEFVTQARAEDVPVVSIAAIIQHNTSGFAAPKSKGITRPKDFEGKKYGAFGSPTEKAMLTQLMKCDGADVEKVQFVDIGASDYFVATQRDVDFAWVFYGWTGIEAELRNEPQDMVMLSDWSHCVPDYYTPVIITSEKLIAEKPDLVRRFMAATAKGYQYAISHPAESADILLKAAPENNPDLVRRSQEWLSPRYQADAPRWGEQKAEVWQRYADWMADAGLLPKRVDTSKAFTNQFLP